MGDTFTLEEGKENEYELIPEGTVIEAKVGKVQTVTTKMTDEDTGEPVRQVEFTFLLQDEPYKGRKAWGRTSTKFTTNENCRLRAWVTEIMGVNSLAPGFSLNLDDLTGMYCRVVIEVNTWEDKKAGPDPDTGEPRFKSNNRVREVIRSRNAGRPVIEEEPF